jgi:hypothetical protein
MKRKGAMEMSVGTIVTIVLLMTVLILGLVLVRSIFSASTSSIDQIDSKVQNEINKLFADEGNLVIYPSDRQVSLKREDDPRGFAFSVKNNDVETADFTYNLEVDSNFDEEKCGSTFSKEKGNDWLLVSSGSFTLGPGNSLDLPELVLFQIPETAPPCTIPYKLEINEGEYSSATVYVTIK